MEVEIDIDGQQESVENLEILDLELLQLLELE